jgi:hypothetical protein
LPPTDRIADDSMILSDEVLFHTLPLALIVADKEINAKKLIVFSISINHRLMTTRIVGRVTHVFSNPLFIRSAQL